MVAQSMRACLVLALAVVASTGCHNNYVRSEGQSVARAGAVGASQSTTGPLSSKVTQGAMLVAINSIEIAPPVISGSRRGRVPTPEELQDMILHTAQEIMTLKITAAKPAKGARAQSGVDGVLRMELTQFQDRQGSSMGGEPATVSFRMTLISSRGSVPVWQAQYYYHQEALSDNWLRIGDRLGSTGTGAGWASGEALLQRGVSAALEDFNKRREQQFVVTGQ